VEAREN